MSESIWSKLDAIHKDLAGVVEELGEAVYHSIESETLKRVAIEAGVDHTTEGTAVIEAIGAKLQRERDVNRELRRQVAAFERREANRDYA